MAFRKKKFALRAEQIVPLATNRGGCIATDMITVDRKPEGYMYREEADNKIDSGWRFMSGYESRSTWDNPRNHEVYDINTIANYDPDIIQFLDSPVGSAFERKQGKGPLQPISMRAA